MCPQKNRGGTLNFEGVFNSNAASFSTNSLEVGKKYLLGLGSESSSSSFGNRTTITSYSGCTLELISSYTNKYVSNLYRCFALYWLIPTAATISITTNSDQYGTSNKQIIEVS